MAPGRRQRSVGCLCRAGDVTPTTRRPFVAGSLSQMRQFQESKRPPPRRRVHVAAHRDIFHAPRGP